MRVTSYSVDNPAMTDIRYAHPLLGRFHELDLFRDILDDIGLEDRSYAGIIIEVHFSHLLFEITLSRA